MVKRDVKHGSSNFLSRSLRECKLECDGMVATKEHERRDKQRKLCKEHGIFLARVVNTNKELETAMEYIRRQLV